MIARFTSSPSPLFDPLHFPKYCTTSVGRYISLSHDFSGVFLTSYMYCRILIQQHQFLDILHPSGKVVEEWVNWKTNVWNKLSKDIPRNRRNQKLKKKFGFLSMHTAQNLSVLSLKAKDYFSCFAMRLLITVHIASCCFLFGCFLRYICFQHPESQLHWPTSHVPFPHDHR